MHVLAIDTSTAQVAVAIGGRDRVLGELRLVGGRRHAEQLVPAIRQLSTETGVALGELTMVAVGIGPGLFTGLRVGVTTAAVMAQALRIPVVGVPSLDLVAHPLRHTSRAVVAVLDARRHEVFHAVYRPAPGGLERMGGYAVSSPVELVTEIHALGEPVLVAGNGVDCDREAFERLEQVELAGPGFDFPSVTALVEIASARAVLEQFDASPTPQPLYLRPSDAEQIWERKAADTMESLADVRSAATTT
jgi:tRNA threonylcarbamoyladenosine biosynthesis protein TsaB